MASRINGAGIGGSNDNETSEAPLCVVIGPNSVMVGRGGDGNPNYFASIVPKIESSLLGRFLAGRSSTASSGDGAGAGGVSGDGGSADSAVKAWRFPPHIQQLAEDELLIVVFPTEWSREVRVALARLVFEELKAASAVFVCSAVAVGYSVGLGLDGEDTHTALYGDIADEKKRRRRSGKKESSDSGSSDSDDDDESSESSSSEEESESNSDSDDDNAKSSKNKKGKGKNAKESTKKTSSSSTATKQSEGAKQSAASGANTSNSGGRTDTAMPTKSLGSNVVTPRHSTKLCTVELNYDRLTCAFVSSGAVSRFVSVPLRVPSSPNASLLSLREASTRLLFEAKRNGANAATINATARESLFANHAGLEELLKSLFACGGTSSASGMVPSTQAKLEKKIAVDIAVEEDRSTSSADLVIDFQVALVFTGEASTILGMRDAFTSHGYDCSSASPYDSANHRVLLPSIAATSSAPLFSAALSHLDSAGFGSAMHPSLVADLTPFMGASVLSTVPDKVIEKVAVTRAMYQQKGADVVLIRSAI